MLTSHVHICLQISHGAGWSVAVTAVINTSLLRIRLFLVELFSIPEVSYTHRLTGFSPPAPLSFAIRPDPWFCSVSSRNITWGAMKMSCADRADVPRTAFCSYNPFPWAMQIYPLCSLVLLRREVRCCNPLVSPNNGRIFVCFPPPVLFLQACRLAVFLLKVSRLLFIRF